MRSTRSTSTRASSSPRLPEDLPQQPYAGHRRSRRPGRQADLGLRVRGHPPISGPQIWPLLSPGRAPRVQVEEWLFWQVGGWGRWPARPTISSITPGGPALCQEALYRRGPSPVRGDEQRLAARKFLAGAYSIADMACWSWVLSASKYTPLDEFPQLKAWRDRVGARPAVNAARRWRRRCANPWPKKTGSPVRAARRQPALALAVCSPFLIAH
jgi:hypothetical protein